MELSHQEYPALLTTLQPHQAVKVLNDRIKTIGNINTDVVEWLAERRRVEEAYITGLRRLASRRLDSAGSLGVFQTPWQSLIATCESIADSHDAFSRKTNADVEKPLREYASKNRNMNNISTVQGNLASLARDVDEASKKSDKIMSKGNRADSTKLSGALSGVQEAQQQWESQAPYVFEQLQALDENRVNHLRDCLTQLQTLQTDQLERSSTAVASSLEAILNVDTSEEISTFVARTTGSAPALSSITPITASQRRMSRHSANSAHGPPLAGTAGSIPPVPTVPQDANSSRPARTELSLSTAEAADEARDQMPPPETPKKSSLGGLRRLGTVMSRKNRDSKAAPSSSEKKSKPSRNPLRRGHSSRNTMYQLESPGGSMTDLAETVSRQSAPSRDRPRERTPQREGNANGTPGPASSTSALPTAAQLIVQANGSTETSQQAQDKQPLGQPPSSEGESVTSPKPSTAISAIDQAQQEAAATEGEQPSFNVNIRNEPIPEEDSDAAKAFLDTANMLRAGAPPPQRKIGTVRGRRDVRNTIFVPSNTSLEAAGLGLPSDTLAAPPSDAVRTGTLTPNLTGSSARSGEEHRNAADAQSIRSAHSLSSMGPAPIKHPEMTAPGLNASVVETSSAWFSNGQVTKATVVGEMALVHNGETAAGSTEHVRIDNFPVLEKVAPNPVFISALADKSGEYKVDLFGITRTQVAFKYQIHLGDGNLAVYAPVLLTPSWKVEPTQLSVILNYAFNPSFGGGARTSVSLQNAVVMLSVEGAKATSCQSRPAGTFSREKNMIYWRLGDVHLEQNSGSGRLLARFATEGEAKPGNAEARWEIAAPAAAAGASEAAAEVGSGLGLSAGSGGTGPHKEGDSDPFADEGVVYKEVPVARKMVSGRYIAT